MAPKVPSKISGRKLPEIKISKAQIEKMKMTAAVLEMLADKPDLIKRIAEEYVAALSATREDRVIAGIELKQKVTAIVAETMRKIPADQIEKYYPVWSNIIYKFYIPHYWIPQNIQYWADQGPIFEQDIE
jgi:aspartyl-tRNA synthetase